MGSSSESSAEDDFDDVPSEGPAEVAGPINIPVLARICDDIRASILSYRPPGSWKHLTQLNGLIAAFLAEEETPKMHVSLETIRACRLDRLLDNILDPDHHPRDGESEDEFMGLVSKTYKLQRAWQARLNGAYDELDDVRCKELLTTGRLQGLRFSLEGSPRWVAKKGSERPNATSIEVGM